MPWARFWTRSPRDDRSSTWNGEGVQVAIDIQGTLNQETDQDTLWTAEIALPFAVFAPYAPQFAPDRWRRVASQPVPDGRCGQSAVHHMV